MLGFASAPWPTPHQTSRSRSEGFGEVAGIIAGRPLYHFNLVHSFCFCTREDELGDWWRDVELVMAELEPPHARVGILFHRVKNVSFSDFHQIMGLYFQRADDRGWEGVRFEVGDYEDGYIHLLCYGLSLFDPKRSA